MTRQRSILLTAATAAVVLAGAASLAQEQPPTTTTQLPAPAVFVPSQLAPAPAPAVVVPVADLKPLVEPIQRATHPSDAVSAYARATSAAGNHLAVQDAYMRKMVEFNLPDLAESQAREILKQDPRNEVAVAVTAYTLGRRGQAVDALATIVQAANVTDQATTEPFVLRTAGQLVAWYDTRADKQTIPDALRNDVESMRKKLSTRDDFGLAYAGARDAYLGRAPTTPDVQPQQPQAQSQVPAYVPSGTTTTVSTAPVDPQPQVVEIPSTNVYTSNVYTYPEPYYYEPYYYPTYYSSPFLYSSFYYGRYYDPCYSTVIVRDHHHHGKDWHHGGRDWDRGRDRDRDNDGHHGNNGSGRPQPTPSAPRVHRYDDVGGRPGALTDRRVSVPSDDGKIVWSNSVRATPSRNAGNLSSDVVRSRSSAPAPRVSAPPPSSARRIDPTPTQRFQPVRTSPSPSRSVDRPSSPSRSVDRPSSPSRSAPAASPSRSSSGGGGGSRSSASSSRAR